MSVRLDARLLESGTRFRIFPQPRYLAAFATPETVRVSVPPDQIQLGPGDDRMYVVDAIGKLPYGRFSRPPYLGPKHPPVQPGPDGHFDHIDLDSRAFSAATMYATVRRVLDIMEDYFGRRLQWHFSSDFNRLEMIPLIEWNNAQSGYGFLEFGFGSGPMGGIDHSRPYCQNFDVLAHELGHSIVFATVGVPRSDYDDGIDYGGMHEASGDLTAIVSVLHFQTVVDYLLAQTKGNLFTVNELNRVGELTESREIRVAFNYARMSDVGEQPHDRSLPLTGAFFDVLVETFQKCLVARSLISQDLAQRSQHGPGVEANADSIQREFACAYNARPAEFKQCLLEARDYLGHLLAGVWDTISPDFLNYHDILNAALAVDQELTSGQNQQTIRECFAWREIGPPPNSLLLRCRRLDECGVRGPTGAHMHAPADANGDGDLGWTDWRSERAAPSGRRRGRSARPYARMAR